jgi:hypothetical protein
MTFNGGVLLVGIISTLMLVGAAPAAAQSAWWNISAGTAPTHLRPGGSGRIILDVTNLGDTAANGAAEPITIADTLPAGLTATSIAGSETFGDPMPEPTCSLASLTCTINASWSPYATESVEIGVNVNAGVVSGEQNQISVTGGQTPRAAVYRALTISDEPVAFGVEDYELTPFNEDGSIDTQAGSHPFQLTTTLRLNDST